MNARFSSPQAEEIAAEFIRQIEADPSIEVGNLPWKMTEPQWEIFKYNPERFRKHRQTTEEEYWDDMRDWAHGTGKYAHDRKDK